MKRFYVLCIAALFAAAGIFVFQPSTRAQKSDKFKRSERAIPNRYIVVLEDANPELSARDVGDVANELTAEFAGTVDRVFRNAIKGYSVEMTPMDAESLSGDSLVKYVEEDSFVSAADTEYNPAWALDRIDQRAMPYDNAYNYYARGTGVNVYVLDSGILTTHVELQGRAFEAYDAVHDPTPISQCNGHGTGVSGVVGSVTYGSAKNVSLHSVRVLPCTGYGTVSDVISGVDWVTRHAIHPAVANMSLETSYSRAMNDAVDSSMASGVTYVVAAGNDTDDACRYSPSSLSGAISVGSSNSLDARVYYSNFGRCVDLFAPGEGVRTIWNTTNTTVTYGSGTSFACPYVAGVAALYLETHPLASPAEVQNAITGNATPSVIYDAGEGSPNLLLYSLMDAGGGVACSGTNFGGILPGSGSMVFQSSSLGFSGASGRYSGDLRVPDGLTAILALEKKSKSQWATVATSTGSPTEQTISYRGRSGTYRWRIASVTGGGSYSLCAVNP